MCLGRKKVKVSNSKRKKKKKVKKEKQSIRKVEDIEGDKKWKWIRKKETMSKEKNPEKKNREER